MFLNVDTSLKSQGETDIENRLDVGREEERVRDVWKE